MSMDNNSGYNTNNYSNSGSYNNSNRDNRDNNSGSSINNIIPNSVLFNRKAPSKKGSQCPLSKEGAPKIDYKDITLLSQYVSERGRIIPSRISNVCAIKQRELKRAIKRARAVALLPYSAT